MLVSNKIDGRFFTGNMILDEMKIAIPTKDGKQIGTSFKNSPYYKIFKIKNGQIQHYNVVRNELGNNILDDSELLKTNLYGKKCIEECNKLKYPTCLECIKACEELIKKCSVSKTKK